MPTASRICTLLVVTCALISPAFSQTTQTSPTKNAVAPQKNASAVKKNNAPKKRVKNTTQNLKSNTESQNEIYAPSYSERAEVMAQVPEMAQRLGLDADWVKSVIGQAKQLDQVRRFILPAPAGVAKNWNLYRGRFIDPIRIEGGVRFWEANQADIEKAERMYGVPAEIIVAIVGVESLYGKQMGNFRTIDALATLTFDFPTSHPRAPERQAFFKQELENLLVLSHHNKADPLQVKGSYAGAIGMPQFMPSSISKYAVDFDGDQKIDLQNSTSDVIGSVGNYFKSFGWVKGMPTHYPVKINPETANMPALLAADILPSFTPESFQEKGAFLEVNSPASSHAGKLALIELQNGPNPAAYVAGTDNFYVITRYNWSSYYAMAVIELGQAIVNKRAAQ